MRPQDEIDFAQGQEYASGADFHEATPIERVIVKSSNRRAFRFIMYMFGLFSLAWSFLSLGYNENSEAIARAVVGFAICICARVIIPTD